MMHWRSSDRRLRSVGIVPVQIVLAVEIEPRLLFTELWHPIVVMRGDALSLALTKVFAGTVAPGLLRRVSAWHQTNYADTTQNIRRVFRSGARSNQSVPGPDYCEPAGPADPLAMLPESKPCHSGSLTYPTKDWKSPRSTTVTQFPGMQLWADNLNRPREGSQSLLTHQTIRGPLKAETKVRFPREC
jgi:hypothetical protein